MTPEECTEARKRLWLEYKAAMREYPINARTADQMLKVDHARELYYTAKYLEERRT